MRLQFLNDIANDAKSTQIKNYVIITCLRLLISSLPGSTLRTHVELLGKPSDVNKGSQSLALSKQASRCQQTFSKPCLVNLISKDTHLVFSI